MRVGLTKESILSSNNQYYNWIGRPVRTTKKSICHETERAVADLTIRMKISRRGASNSDAQKIIFWRVILKNGRNMPQIFLRDTVGCASSKDLIRRSRVLLKCLNLKAN